MSELYLEEKEAENWRKMWPMQKNNWCWQAFTITLAPDVFSVFPQHLPFQAQGAQSKCWEKVLRSRSSPAVVHSCLRDKVHPGHLGGHRHTCPLYGDIYQESEITQCTGCTFQWPQLLSNAQHSQCLQDPTDGRRWDHHHFSNSLMPRGTMKPTDGCPWAHSPPLLTQEDSGLPQFVFSVLEPQVL